MNNYSFEKINCVYVLGDCHGEFKTYFHEIKQGLSIKSEDEDKPHPKELERQARKAAREQAQMQIGRQLHEGLRGYGRNLGRFGEMPNNGWAHLDSSEKIKNMLKMNSGRYSNSIFIIAGDCGIGFNKQKYYDDLFERFNKILSYNNTFIIFVRGNHDDPEYFDGKRVNLSNIKAVPDYSVITACGKNILCVGGAISLDRTWRIKQEERINRFSSTKKKTIYWKNEAPVFRKDLLDEITKSAKIDYVVSHSAPSFVSPESHVGLDEWSENDRNLISDVTEERKVLDKVFEALRDSNMRPTYWAYGHFDLNFIEKRSETIFRALGDGFNPFNIEIDIISFIQNEVNKKMKAKVKNKSIDKKPVESDREQVTIDVLREQLNRQLNERANGFMEDPMFVGHNPEENGIGIEQNGNAFDTDEFNEFVDGLEAEENTEQVHGENATDGNDLNIELDAPDATNGVAVNEYANTGRHVMPHYNPQTVTFTYAPYTITNIGG